MMYFYEILILIKSTNIIIFLLSNDNKSN